MLQFWYLLCATVEIVCVFVFVYRSLGEISPQILLSNAT